MAKPIRIKDHLNEAGIVQRRIILATVVIVLLSGVLLARMFWLQVVQYEHHATLSENNRVHVQPIPPARGRIYDRNGVVLAENRPSFSLNITRERVPDLETTVALLQSLLELDDEDINQLHRRLGQRRRPFEAVPVMFNLTEDQIARIAVTSSVCRASRCRPVSCAIIPGRSISPTPWATSAVSTSGRWRPSTGSPMPEPTTSARPEWSGSTSTCCMARSVTRKWRPTPAAGYCGCSSAPSRNPVAI